MLPGKNPESSDGTTAIDSAMESEIQSSMNKLEVSTDNFDQEEDVADERRLKQEADGNHE